MAYLKDRSGHEVSIKGVSIIVRRGVFSPDPMKTNSTIMVLNNLPHMEQKNVLDMGCGSGIIGIYCAIIGAKKVIAADNDGKSLKNAKENIKRNKVEHTVKVIKSDLFENVKGSFDYIFGNLPINDSGWDLGISTADLMERFLSECGDHIKQGGTVYFTWNSGSDVAQIRNLLSAKGYEFEEVIENKPDRTWHLFKLHF